MRGISLMKPVPPKGGDGDAEWYGVDFGGGG